MNKVPFDGSGNQVQNSQAAGALTSQEAGANQTDNTVVHKDKNGTITVQSTKTVGKSNYSFVSVSPT